MLSHLIAQLFMLLTTLGLVLFLSSQNTMISLVALAFCFFCSSVILIFMGSEFIALMLTILYMGAIIVFFLFSVMLLDHKLIDIHKNNFGYVLPFYFSFGTILFCIFIAPNFLFFSEPDFYNLRIYLLMKPYSVHNFTASHIRENLILETLLETYYNFTSGQFGDMVVSHRNLKKVFYTSVNDYYMRTCQTCQNTGHSREWLPVLHQYAVAELLLTQFFLEKFIGLSGIFSLGDDKVNLMHELMNTIVKDKNYLNYQRFRMADYSLDFTHKTITFKTIGQYIPNLNKVFIEDALRDYNLHYKPNVCSGRKITYGLYKIVSKTLALSDRPGPGSYYEVTTQHMNDYLVDNDILFYPKSNLVRDIYRVGVLAKKHEVDRAHENWFSRLEDLVYPTSIYPVEFYPRVGLSISDSSTCAGEGKVAVFEQRTANTAYLLFVTATANIPKLRALLILTSPYSFTLISDLFLTKKLAQLNSLFDVDLCGQTFYFYFVAYFLALGVILLVVSMAAVHLNKRFLNLKPADSVLQLDFKHLSKGNSIVCAK